VSGLYYAIFEYSGSATVSLTASDLLFQPTYNFYIWFL